MDISHICVMSSNWSVFVDAQIVAQIYVIFAKIYTRKFGHFDQIFSGFYIRKPLEKGGDVTKEECWEEQSSEIWNEIFGV